MNDASLQQVEVKPKQLRKYEAQFDKYQKDLEVLDPDESEPKATVRSDFEDRVTAIKAKLLERQAFLQKRSYCGTSKVTAGSWKTVQYRSWLCRWSYAVSIPSCYSTLISSISETVLSLNA